MVSSVPLLFARFGLLALGAGLFGSACFSVYAPWAARRPGPTSLRLTAPATAAVAGLVWLLALWAETTGGRGPSLAQFCLTTPSGLGLSAAILCCLALALMAFIPAAPKVRAYVAGALLVGVACV